MKKTTKTEYTSDSPNTPRSLTSRELTAEEIENQKAQWASIEDAAARFRTRRAQ